MPLKSENWKEFSMQTNDFKNATSIIAKRYEHKEKTKGEKILNKALQNPYILISPCLFFDLALTIFPMFFAIYISFFKWDPVKQIKKFIGFRNYQYLFQSEDFIKVI